MIKNFDVEGMSCAACSARIESSVGKVDGIKKVSVNLLMNKMQAEFDETVLSADDIINEVEKAGYRAHLAASSVQESSSSKEKSKSIEVNYAEKLKKRFFTSLGFLIPLMYFSMGHMIGLPLPGFLSPMKNPSSFALVQLILTVPVIAVNFKFFESGFKAVIKKAPNMDTLVSLGSVAAFAFSLISMFKINSLSTAGNIHEAGELAMSLYFESAAMILALVTLGKFFEERSKGRTKDAVEKLMRLSPETALVERDGAEAVVSTADISVGDVVILKPGDYIPVDGEVISGHSTVDASAVTGESLPIEVSEGAYVTSAAINLSGYMKIKAKKVGADTTISKIIELVENAGGSKAPIAKLADRISGVFVPVVTALAVIVFIIWIIISKDVSRSLNFAISVLVISCPCALGLATPVAIMVGTGKGASMGILFKNAEVLEKLHSVDTVLLDKTATVTEGKPSVVGIFPTEKSEEILRIAASLEKNSAHPLADAIVSFAEGKGIALSVPESFEYLTGRGIVASLDGRRYFLGNEKLLRENGMDFAVPVFDGTPVLLADEGGYIGAIEIKDRIKESSIVAVHGLKARGISVAMLTGDNKRTAELIAAEVGIDEVYSEVLPEDKLGIVSGYREKNRITAMVGDGINDAPALKEADVGIAIGSGTDVAIEAADVVLVKDNLVDVDVAVALSGRTIKNIKQNLFWAFFYNCAAIPVAAGAFAFAGFTLNPMIAAAAMSVSSLFVVTNALRLKRFKYGNDTKKKGDTEMEKIKIKVGGMSCGHCSARVEAALNEIDGVSAKVSHKKNIAEITLSKPVERSVIASAIENAGYKVID